MKKIFIIIIAFILPSLAFAQTKGENVISRANSSMKNILDRARKTQDEIMDDYEEKQRQVMEEYKAYCSKIMKKWGDVKIVESTKKDWVEYSKDESSRSIVDFEKGKVTVEVLTDPGESEEVIDKKLEEAIDNLLASKGKMPDFESEVLPQEDVSDKPILEGQIDMSKYNDNTSNIIKEEKKETKTIDTEEGKKNIVSISLELMEDHIPKRAQGFKDEIRKHSNRFDINEPLIYAIMEQESYFNPMARSSAGAYGLMQIVPSSGGLDANRYVHKIDRRPSPKDLYRPDYNIELGTGYLKKQMDVYFSGVKDLRCRMLCAIAAYNTGQNNVYYTFTGKRKIDGAFNEINKYTYEQLYEHLKRHLPHPETRDYIQKVTEKMKKYTK